jgi:hypothetical protein
VPNPGSAPYTPEYNGRAYTNPNGDYQAPYITVAYTDPIPLQGSSVGFLPNSAYHNVTWHNMLGQPEFDGFGYESPPQFPFRLQPIDMMPGSMDPNNLTKQLATIMRESFVIEPKGRGCIHQNPYPDYYDQHHYPIGYRVPKFSMFSMEHGKTTLQHVGQFIL